MDHPPNYCANYLIGVQCDGCNELHPRTEGDQKQIQMRCPDGSSCRFASTPFCRFRHEDINWRTVRTMFLQATSEKQALVDKMWETMTKMEADLESAATSLSVSRSELAESKKQCAQATAYAHMRQKEAKDARAQCEHASVQNKQMRDQNAQLREQNEQLQMQINQMLSTATLDNDMTAEQTSSPLVEPRVVVIGGCTYFT